MAPIMIGLITVQRAAAHVRTVDFLLLFAGGAAFGIGLGGLIAVLMNRRGTGD
jgi:hypothetical protein